MRLLKRKTLLDFSEKHPDSKSQMFAFAEILENANWKSMNEMKLFFSGGISFLSNNRVVFDIKGNHYRVVIKFAFTAQIAYVRFVGTHSQYDKIDANNV